MATNGGSLRVVKIAQTDTLVAMIIATNISNNFKHIANKSKPLRLKYRR